MKRTVCIDNKGYEAALETRKLYEMLDDDKAAKLGLLRVIDESGEDYLYPETMFEPITIMQSLEKRLLVAGL